MLALKIKGILNLREEIRHHWEEIRITGKKYGLLEGDPSGLKVPRQMISWVSVPPAGRYRDVTRIKMAGPRQDKDDAKNN